MGAVSELAAGQIFAGDYRIVRPLAEGGMGAVFVVDQLSTGKARALKLMRPELAGDAELRRRFEQEAKIGARIESDHVVEIVAAGVDEDTKAPFIVMELLVGEDLAARLDRSGPLAPPEVLDLFEQLCHAITAAHDAGIVHRDLKPENVFLSSSKRAGTEARRIDVKVLDFGIAKLVAETTAKMGTQGMIGTPLWMAPEQTERGRVTPAADVWALGLILYRALTGRTFWRSAADPEVTFSQIMKEVCLGPIPAASLRAREQGVAERWPTALDKVFGLCMQREPVKRYAHAGFLWANLKEALLPLCPPESSQRIMLAAAPSSARVLAGASPAHALDATATPAPLPSPAMPTPAAPVVPVVLQPPPGKPLLSSSFGGGTDIRGVPIRAFVGGIVALGVISLSVYASRVRARAMEPSEVRELPTDPVILGTPSPPSPKGTPPARCRLCTIDVTTNGPLAKADITRTVDAALPMLASQCLAKDPRGRSRGTKAGVATITFTVREGRAVNRRNTAGDGECFARGLGDVVFPPNDVGTDVNYTVRFDSSAD